MPFVQKQGEPIRLSVTKQERMLAAKAAHSEHFSSVRRRLCGCTCTAASAAAQCLWLDRWASGISDVSCWFQTKRELIVSEYHSTEQQFVESMQMLVEVSSGRGHTLVEVSSGRGHTLAEVR